MTRKQDLPRVRALRDIHALALRRLALKGNSRSRFFRMPSAAFDHAVAIDPTPKAIYISSILRWLHAGSMQHEDARRVRDVLERFHARKHLLPVEQRDIGRYETPGDVSELVGGFAPLPIVEVPEVVLCGGPSVAKGEDWAIYRIQTPESAIWWADSTEWCTRHRHIAEQYLQLDDLFVVVSPIGKLQFHVREGQFMDRYDRGVHDLSSLADDCLDAILDIVDAVSGPATISFRPAAVEAVVQRERYRRGFEFHDPAYLTEDWSASNGMRVRELPHSGKVMTSRRDGVVDRKKIDAASMLEELNGDTVLAAFLRSGIDRLVPPAPAAGAPASSMALERHNEACLALDWLRPGCNRRLVVHTGRRYLIWEASNEDPDGAAYEVFDADAPLGARAFRFVSPKDLNDAPSGFEDALASLTDRRDFLPIVRVIGASKVPDTIREEARRPKCRAGGLLQMSMYPDARPQVLSAIDLHFGDRDGPALERLVSSMHIKGMRAWRFDGDNASSPTDLEQVQDVQGAGIVLAGIRDEDCSEELVDRLISLGRREALAVAPARLLTKERILRAYWHDDLPRDDDYWETELWSTYSGRTVSLASLEALEAAAVELGELDGDRLRSTGLYMFVHHFVHGKGHYYLLDHLAGKQAFFDVPNIANTTNDRLMEQLLESNVRYTVRMLYEDVAPVGKPWPLLLEAMRTSKEGLEDVCRSLRNGDWGPDIEERWEQLMQIPGIEAAIVAGERNFEYTIYQGAA